MHGLIQPLGLCSYPSGVPVSRKRKKKKSGSSGRSSERSRSPMSQQGSDVAAAGRDRRELAQAFQSLAAYRDQVDTQRAARAATMAIPVNSRNSIPSFSEMAGSIDQSIEMTANRGSSHGMR